MQRLPGRRLVDGIVSSRADGGLAGSVLAMGRAVRNLVEFTGCTIEAAVAAAQRARLLSCT